MFESAGVDYKFEPHVIKYTLPGRKYLPDFKIGDLYIETKGRFKPEDRRKMIAVLDSNPDLNIVMVFSHPNQTITKKSKTTYGEWCSKNGIPWIGLNDFETLIKKDKNAHRLFNRKAGMDFRQPNS